MRRAWVIAAALAAVLASGAPAGAVQPGETVPEITVPTVQGETDFTMSDHRNEVVVVALFRTD